METFIKRIQMGDVTCSFLGILGRHFAPHISLMVTHIFSKMYAPNFFTLHYVALFFICSS